MVCDTETKNHDFKKIVYYKIVRNKLILIILALLKSFEILYSIIIIVKINFYFILIYNTIALYRNNIIKFICKYRITYKKERIQSSLSKFSDKVL